MSFGSRLKEMRIDNNCSQRKVADDVGVAITTISQYERDNRFPNEQMLKRLCLYYNISADYLLELTDEKRSPLSKSEFINDISSKQANAINKLLDVLEKDDC